MSYHDYWSDSFLLSRKQTRCFWSFCSVVKRKLNLWNHKKCVTSVQNILPVRPSQPSLIVDTAVHDGSDLSAKCESYGFRPRNITVQWTFRGSIQVPTFGPTISNNGTEIYAMAASYFRTISKQDNKATLKCSVTHKTLSTPLYESATIDVLCELLVTDKNYNL